MFSVYVEAALTARQAAWRGRRDLPVPSGGPPRGWDQDRAVLGTKAICPLQGIQETEMGQALLKTMQIHYKQMQCPAGVCLLLFLRA